MTLTRLTCDHCGSALEGAFETPAGPAESPARKSGPLGAGRGDSARFGRLARLDDEQLEFVEVFLRCRGVIKNVEDMLGVSYPTVRARLNTTLDAMGFGADEEAPAERRRARREILGELAAGRISAVEAHELLARAHALTDSTEDDG